MPVVTLYGVYTSIGIKIVQSSVKAIQVQIFLYLTGRNRIKKDKTQENQVQQKISECHPALIIVQFCSINQIYLSINQMFYLSNVLSVLFYQYCSINAEISDRGKKIPNSCIQRTYKHSAAKFLQCYASKNDLGFDQLFT